MKILSSIAACSALLLSSCVHSHKIPVTNGNRAAIDSLETANQLSLPSQQRAVWYLSSAQTALQGMKSDETRADNLAVYNEAAAHLTMLLREADRGTMWNRPLTLSHGGKTYRLRYAAGSSDGVWSPSLFSSFTPSNDVKLKSIKNRVANDGIGGKLVGVQQDSPLQPFAPRVGISAAVTAVIDFQGSDATLQLIDPTKKQYLSMRGNSQPVAADYSAPLAYYPHASEIINGFMGAIKVDKYMNVTGLYMLQPYDPDKIPLIFVHGLVSTARKWRTVINEIERDPTLRGRYQCWVFGYPTGNPPSYSALRLREELAKVKHRYPGSKDFVLVGHSMGGLLSRMQVTNLERNDWDLIGKDKAQKFFSNVKSGSIVDQSLIFQANPHIDRVIYICTPHRGSEMAIGSIGELAMRLIALPGELTSQFTESLGDSLAVWTGSPKRLPNSVSGLSPTNPTLKVLDSKPMTVPFHSIIGDRGKGDTPNSSDGVVEYWSSSVKGAQSEKIVPGPHGACELPETITELQRILKQHLRN